MSPEWLPADPGGIAARIVRPGLVVLSLLVLAAAVAVAFQALLHVAELWFERQYAPIVRAALALAVAGAAAGALRALLRRPAADA